MPVSVSLFSEGSMSSRHRNCRFNDCLMIRWRKSIHSKRGVKMMKRAVSKRERRQMKKFVLDELEELVNDDG